MGDHLRIAYHPIRDNIPMMLFFAVCWGFLLGLACLFGA
jgi:hypothetical protein